LRQVKRTSNLDLTNMLPRPSAGGVVLNAAGKMLLVYQHSDSWSLPKGGIEVGESELAAAEREIGEETGVTDLTLVTELGSYERYSLALGGKEEQKEWGLRKRTVFLFTTNQTQLRQHDPRGEITEVRWVTIDEALSLLTHPKDKEFLASVREKVEDAVK
jgi:8-oxo-(d)GTP phosphatase